LTSLGIQHSQLLKILKQPLPTNTIQYNSEITSISQQEDKYELVIGSDGGAKSEEDLVDLVVAADGLNSHLRKKFVRPSKGNEIRQLNGLLVQGIGSSSSLASPDQSADELLEVWGNGQRFGCCRISKDKVWWYATVHSSFKAETVSPTALSQSFSSFPGNVASLIASTPTSSYQAETIVDLPAHPPIYKDGVVLLGSASAALTIDYHQQPAQCLESALTLALSLVSSASVAAALDRYSKVRIPRLGFLGSAAYSETESAINKSRFMSSLRDMATSMMPRQVSNTTQESAVTYSVFKDFPEAMQDFKAYRE